jgi:adenylate cyclase class 2
MNTEFEVKFVSVDHDAVREKLQTLGAQLEKPMRLMKRAIIETPALKANDAFMRVRDEGDRVTLTYKQFKELSIDGAKEYEVVVSDFQTTVDILFAAGMPYRSLQESKRETWTLDGAEVVLDEWPWLRPYIEIEGEGEQHVKDVAVKLGYKWSDAVFGDVMAAYRVQYPHLSESDTVGNIPEVRFQDPMPPLLISVNDDTK